MKLKRFICASMTALMVSACMPTAVFAGGGYELIENSGEYSYTGALTDSITVKENTKNVEITIEDVTITGNAGPAISIEQGAEVTLILEGDNTLTGDDGYAAIAVLPAYDDEWNYSEDNSAKLTIKGSGTLTATGGDGDETDGKYGGGAGIGGNGEDQLGGDGVDFGTIIIDRDFSGTINAIGGKDSELVNNDNKFGGGAGIGSGGFNMAYNEDYTDVGTYFWGAVYGAIEINSGTINAGSNGCGAGIGGGSGQGEDPALSYISIEINGGNIKASGGALGAGIGGGGMCDGGNVNISDGTVVAKAGEEDGAYGASGIGGGNDASVNSVIITGGEVTATASGGAAGIGGGTNTTYSSIHYGDTDGNRTDGKIGKIEISGNNTIVKSYGGTGIGSSGNYGGSGIGSGYPISNNRKSVAFDISLSDEATVYAKGGYHSQAIGYGYRPTDYIGYGIKLEIDDSVNLLAVNEDYYQPALTATTEYDDDPITYSSSDKYLICYTDDDKNSAAASSNKVKGYLGSPYSTDSIEMEWDYENNEITLTLDGSNKVIDTDDFDINGNWAVISSAPIPKEYTVEFESNGGSEIESQKVEEGGSIKEPEDPTRGGYDFKGWYKDENFEDEWNFAEDTVTEEITLYAKWEKVKDDDEDNHNGGGGYELPEKKQDKEPVENIPELETGDHFAYMAGYPDSTFLPEKNMTRAEVAVMFSRMMTKRINEDQTYVPSFLDVTADKWYYNQIGFMEQFGIITGYPDGTFRPEDPITRAEFATMVAKFNKLAEIGTAAFTDVDESHWAAVYIAQVYNRGWASGYPDGTFKPDKNITRAEAVSTINRMLGRNGDRNFIDEHKYEIVNFKDINNAYWAYYDIHEAANAHYYEIDFAESWTELKK